ncbi:cytochrome P450 [Myxococcaceae bacterium GXIMD 01537]
MKIQNPRPQEVTSGQQSRPPETTPGCPYRLGAQANLFAGPMAEAPLAFYARLREEEPITYSPTMKMWILSRYDDICEVLRDPARFSSSQLGTFGASLSDEARAILQTHGVPMGANPLAGPNLLALDPPAHTRLRRLLNRGFTPARVAAQGEHIRRFTHELIDAFLPDGHAELVTQFANHLPLRVILNLVGVPPEDMSRIKHWSDDWFGLLFDHVPAEAQPAMARSTVEYQQYCARLIERRRLEPRDDLLSDIINAEPDGEALTQAELITAIQGSLLAAGHETTTGMLANTWLRLLSEPGLWRRLQEEPALLPRAIDECLRHDGLTTALYRTTTCEVDFHGVRIPQGATLMLLNSSANHDERHFPDPERFDLQRERQNHLTFGRFTHFCLGASLARLEILLATEALLQRVPDLRLVPGQRFEYVRNTMNVGVKSVHVEWKSP